MLVDSLGRVQRSLRISVTERCNMRCRYCMPAAGVEGCADEALLTPVELESLAQMLVGLGVTRLRVTGGEPLLRREIVEIVSRLSQLPGVEDLALTTNGLLLERLAAPLKEAGLVRVNISVDSLDAARFAEITRTDTLARVWRGVEQALHVGFKPVKINVVALHAINDDEVGGWLELINRLPVHVRFMELMPVGEGARLSAAGHHEDLSALEAKLVHTRGLIPASVVGNGPARVWSVPDAQGTLGFITPVSAPYCGTCSRLRLDATGVLRTCMAFEEGRALAPMLRAGHLDELRAAIAAEVHVKPWGHAWREGQETARSMSRLGG
jgi:cyclic pyranopterin phosphate synthase